VIRAVGRTNNMSKNLILEKSKYIKYYTYLKRTFANIEEFRDIKWLISGIKTNLLIPGLNLDEDIEIIGSDLLEKINGMEHEPQWIWAVLSGFKKNQTIQKFCSPLADGNSRYWKSGVTPEMPCAITEIVCWDSSCTLFIGIDDGVAEKLYNLYPDIMDLDEMNTTSSQQGDAPEPASPAR